MMTAAFFCGGHSYSAFAQGAPAKAAAKSSESGANQSSAFQGFSRDRKEPVKIESNTLEVYDRDKYAMFIGNVFVQQGESTLRCRQLKVFYVGEMLSGQKDKSGQPAKSTTSEQSPQVAKSVKPANTAQANQTAKAAQAGKGTKDGQEAKSAPEQRIRRLEAMGGVIVAGKDQKATGDFGVFDMPTNTATITGNVVVTQGQNVMRGEKLVVDMNTGWSRLEPGGKGAGQRVHGLFVPSSSDEAKDGKGGKAKKKTQPEAKQP